MAPLTQVEIKSHLLCSTTRKARMQAYTDLLGFRKLSQFRSRSGPQAFTGNRVQEFYKETKTVAKELAESYRSWKDIHGEIQAQDSFAQDRIEDLINEYGPVIWTDGRTRSFVTVTDSSDDEDNEHAYRRHLIFSNDEDRVSIRTFIYCLILQRTCRNMRKKPVLPEEEGAIAMEAPYKSTRSSRIEQSCVLPPDPDLVSAFHSNDASYGTAASETGKASRSRATEQYQVPVARMVPTANSFSPTVAPQLNAAVLGLGYGDSVADAEGGFQLNEASPQMQSVASDLSLAEVSDIPPGREEAINPRHGAQKRKKSVHKEATSTEFLTSRSGGTTKRALRLRRTTFSAGPSRLPSPRASSEEMEMILDQTTSDITDPRYDVVSDSERDDNDVIAVTSGRRQEAPITPAVGPTSEDRDYEIDSVQGSPRQSPAAEAQPSPPQDAKGEGEVGEEENPSLIVKLKLINPYEIAQRRLRRHRLALQLPQAFAMPTQHPEALENTVKLITEIRALDCKRFNQVFGERDATRQLILDQWLDFIDIYLRFRREADFHDDLSMWDAHLDSLEPKKRFAKAGCLNEACVSLMEWRLENPTFSMLECSRDVTWVLVQMAEWKRTLKTADVEEIKMRVVEFHRSLLAWFS